MRFVGQLPARIPHLSQHRRGMVRKLQATPGEWWELKVYDAEHASNAYVYVHNCRRGKIKAFSPELGMEVKPRANEDGSVSVYVRYVGAHSEFAT